MAAEAGISGKETGNMPFISLDVAGTLATSGGADDKQNTTTAAPPTDTTHVPVSPPGPGTEFAPGVTAVPHIDSDSMSVRPEPSAVRSRGAAAAQH